MNQYFDMEEWNSLKKANLWRVSRPPIVNMVLKFLSLVFLGLPEAYVFEPVDQQFKRKQNVKQWLSHACHW